MRSGRVYGKTVQDLGKPGSRRQPRKPRSAAAQPPSRPPPAARRRRLRFSRAADRGPGKATRIIADRAPAVPQNATAVAGVSKKTTQ